MWTSSDSVWGISPTRITGNDAGWISGGPDDGHFTILPTHRTVAISSHARITLLDDRGAIFYYHGSIAQLNGFLASDPAGNIFCIQGPASSATALTALFHP